MRCAKQNVNAATSFLVIEISSGYTFFFGHPIRSYQLWEDAYRK